MIKHILMIQSVVGNLLFFSPKPSELSSLSQNFITNTVRYFVDTAQFLYYKNFIIRWTRIYLTQSSCGSKFFTMEWSFFYNFIVKVSLNMIHIWVSSRENLSSGVCEQHKHGPAWASAQSDQPLCYSLFGKYHI